MKKHTVIISENKGANWNYSAMFESSDKSDIDLREACHKTLEKHVGTFKRDKSLKGWFNGHEIGMFTSDKGIKFVVFTDFSVKKYH